MDHNRVKRSIEAIIFASDRPVEAKSLKGFYKNIDSKEIDKLLDELVEEWKSLNKGFTLEKVSGGYQFRTRVEYANDVINFNKNIKKFRLSKAALEVLAIIAYKQPITRVEIDHLRGVDSSGVLNALLEKRLIYIKGRRDIPGKPFEYGTTDLFLETFGINSLKDLPSLKEIEEMASQSTENP